MDMSRTPCLHKPLAPAVQRCCDARNRIIREINANLPPDPDDFENDTQEQRAQIAVLNFARNKHLSEGKKKAEAAYRFAMPDPSTRQGVKDYIACVLHGMTIGIISGKTGAALLSGARVALAGHRGKLHKGAEKENTFGNAENEDQPAA